MNIFDPNSSADLDITTGPRYIMYFDSYSTHRSVKLYWKTGRPFHPKTDLLSENNTPVAQIRLFMSEKGPDTDFILKHQTSLVGDDSTYIGGLQNDKIYYFRLATYNAKDSLLGISNPLMTTPGIEKEILYTTDVNQRESPLYFNNLCWAPLDNNLALIMADDAYNANIYIMNIASQLLTKITDYSGSEYRLNGLDFSPDGKSLCYTYSPSRTSGEIDYKIWTSDIASKEQQSITSGRVDSDPVWFSGDTIIFCKGTYEPPNITQLYKVSVSSGIEKIIPDNRDIYKYTPDVSQASGLIVYSGRNQSPRSLYITDIRGENNRELTSDMYWEDFHPIWSQDGKKVYFTSNRSGHYEIWQIDLNTNKIVQFSHGIEKGRNRFYGRISADKNYIAFLEYDSHNDYVIKILRNMNVNM